MGTLEAKAAWGSTVAEDGTPGADGAEQLRLALPGVADASREPSSAPDDLLARLATLTEPAPGKLAGADAARHLLGRLHAALRADTTAILLHGADERQLIVLASLGRQRALPTALDAGDRHSWPRQAGSESLLTAPLVVEGHSLGILHAVKDSPRRFSLEDAHLLEVAAGRIALDLECARLQEAASGADALATFPLLSTLLRCAPVGIAFVDRRLCFLRVNDMFVELSGVPAAAHIGRAIGGVVPHLADLLEPRVRRVLETGHPLGDVEVCRPPRHWTVHFYPVVRRRTIGVGIIAVDVTQRRRAEEERTDLLRRTEVSYREAQQARAQAEVASRAKDDFLATVSHELRSPLSAIVTWVHLLRKGQLDATKAAGALEVIERNTKLQAQLIDDLLDVSRAIAGELRLEREPVDLAAVIEAVVASIHAQAEGKGVRLQSTVDPSSPWVSGDPRRLEQVLRNLVNNALKFTPSGGLVTVELTQLGSQVEVRVRDTGEGIHPDLLPFVFERFRQGDTDSARRQGGLGLGLAIVRTLVELHGGTVRAESAGEGRGALFVVTLPSGKGTEARQAPRPPDRDESLPRLEGLRVLVVDDRPEARQGLGALLEAWGARVLPAASAAEALAVFVDTRPDIVVVDIAMPYEDGYSLLRKVRALEAGHGGQVPAIALTAYATPEDRSRALETGFQTHLAKPAEPEEIVAAIATLTGRRPR